jgi:hypothetical protein
MIFQSKLDNSNVLNLVKNFAHNSTNNYNNRNQFNKEKIIQDIIDGKNCRIYCL